MYLTGPMCQRALRIRESFKTRQFPKIPTVYQTLPVTSLIWVCIKSIFTKHLNREKCFLLQIAFQFKDKHEMHFSDFWILWLLNVWIDSLNANYQNLRLLAVENWNYKLAKCILFFSKSIFVWKRSLASVGFYLIPPLFWK